ncbi:PilW family protein [Legionella spiritensis]|uniref:Tfp pilus assembly protein PilW n=1 Tax=Legionella spiritensis TaxID=452 RepID=A0A0W0Z9V7_LEGSP|nr:hypothetical protein [Legionella spiritensis]KTD65715.1 hypothetical protein Lspi_0427 [Legionella spiritensis]SNV43321.1 Tfp pilus assembly protein PilW [Legionella spiritensis]VEG90625.1 Tfp pilus assembly protein PilW [Legionella spiritensis]
MRRVIGFSVVELMLSLLLASIIITALIQHYSSGKRQYLLSQNLLKKDYDLQMITDLLRYSIRQAGFTPCASLDWLRVRDGRDGFDPPLAISANADSHHALSIARMSEDFSRVVRVLSPTRLLVDADNSFRVNKPHIIADCFSAEIVIITHVQPVARQLEITINKPLYFAYTEPAYLGAWLEERFYVQKNSHGEPALFYQLDHPEELSNQIHSLNTQLLENRKGLMAHLVLGLVDRKPVALDAVVRVS